MTTPRDVNVAGVDVERLLLDARQGCAQALGTLLDTLRGYLLLVANADLNDELRTKCGASDLVQETFVRAQEGFRDFKGTTEAELRAWLRQILLHCRRNLHEAYRKTGKRDLRREVGPGVTGSSSVAAEELAANNLSPSGQAMASEEAGLVAEALANSPDDYREIVRLRNWENLSFEEIGHRVGCSAEAARKRWYRALQHLADQLEPANGKLERSSTS